MCASHSRLVPDPFPTLVFALLQERHPVFGKHAPRAQSQEPLLQVQSYANGQWTVEWTGIASPSSPLPSPPAALSNVTTCARMDCHASEKYSGLVTPTRHCLKGQQPPPPPLPAQCTSACWRGETASRDPAGLCGQAILSHRSSSSSSNPCLFTHPPTHPSTVPR